ncbi:MAG: glutathione ABC transporter permease GsiC, partial [Acidimicrobiales bacterium]
MAARLALRLGQMLLVTLAVVTIAFFVLRLAAGDPARLVNPPGTPEEIITQTRRRLGTDQPLIGQYFTFLADLVRGDLGTTFRGSLPVRDAVLAALPNTLALAGLAVAAAACLALVLGAIAAWRPNGVLDRATLAYAALAQA